ncbi:hypothetical protein [Roseateles noduli]|uniref:hypothetical protein n=1 Tax=Roseateles noduli TaxID=2052484 RepID=UPI003D65A9A5
MKTRPSDSPWAQHEAVATPGPRATVPSGRPARGNTPDTALESLQRRIDHSPRMQAQRSLLQAVSGNGPRQQHIEPEPLLQRRVGKRRDAEGKDKPVDSWVENGDETYSLSRVADSGEWDKVWKLELFKADASKGVIFIYLLGTVLKPDGLEVKGDQQGLSYGTKLGAAAVKAMNSDALAGETAGADTISLNLVNPLSAHISLKQLTIEINGEDSQDGTAKAAGTTALSTPSELVKRKFYDPAQFPQFWGRLVFLVENNDMVVQCSAFNMGDAYLDSTTINQVNVRTMVETMVRVLPTKGFVMNIKIPKPNKLAL